jgi:hypothetical protein
MQEQLVSFETAQLAKDKGFDWKVRSNYYTKEGIDHGKFISLGYFHESTNFNLANDLCSAPTQSLLQNWLREVHNLHIELILDGYQSDKNDLVDGEFLGYRVFIYKVGSPAPQPYQDLGMQDYEVILEVALQEALKLIS